MLANGVDKIQNINEQDYIGEFSDKKCPKCGASLLINKLGDLWCSFPECDYGCEEVMEYLREESE